MWIDNASKIDMLAYYPYSDMLMDIIKDERMQPLTVGLFGSWGIGKSSLLHILENEIESTEEKEYVCVNLNAWNFEGYEDAKTAIMESLLKSLESKKTVVDEAKGKIKGLLKRIDYLKLASSAMKAGIPLALSLATCNPAPVMFSFTKSTFDYLKDKPEETLNKIFGGVNNFKENYIKDIEEKSIVENLRVFKEEFSKMIESMGIRNLVVLIDDLDRCNPDRILDILEAVKLFLSVDKTTFIFAVDERIVKYAISNKYPERADNTTNISKDYIEKIIQLPIRLPELSVIDVENYLLLLVYELYMKEGFGNLLEQIYKDGVLFNQKRINIEMLDTYCDDDLLVDSEFKKLRDVVEKIRTVIAGALKGNPRQAKRFLNMYLIRRKLAAIYFKGTDSIDDNILAKLMTLEYIDKTRYQQLFDWSQESQTTGISQLEKLFKAVSTDSILDKDLIIWNSEQLKKWVMQQPEDIYTKDLSKYFYLSRDVLTNTTMSMDMLTPEDKEIITFLIQNKMDTTLQKKKAAEIALLDPVRKGNVMKVIYQYFEKKTLPLLTLSSLFLEDTSIQFEIAKVILKIDKACIKAAEVGFFKEMYIANKDAILPAIEALKSDEKITEKMYNYIRGKKED